MKRFAAFVGDRYYPSGGAEDFLWSYDTQEEAEACVKDWIEENGCLSWGR